MPGVAEAELLARLRAGDETAFAAVLDRWSDGMLWLARDFVSTNESAAEVVQDTWLAVIEGIDGFEGRSSLQTWVFRILVNLAKRRGLAEHRSLPFSSVLPADDDSGPTVDPSRFQRSDEPYPHHWRSMPAPWPAPEQALLDSELGARISAALDELPRRQRIVVGLRDLHGYTAAEVCSILEITPANQRVLLHRARAALRGRIEEYLATDMPSDDTEGQPAP
ncbi:RNA polymerase sigma factor [Nocardia huaxiensis]|uniref:Sigma-70 family RNA polymerase sigma factor n=1 Tax=Nocardia huaxiensis TaxID=2755382 RepID=A0A7D6V738_9NOCA|nr:sigma-70 family RNA polymerase sigma factor [Nocardia huaxiensis]QLY29232.1 sigma-70 family RNA polymerase sigma factor [Nocardia huaxiensis]UFS97267.1 sigma-70 family RNA polymerase sigma factor [Nocardia huaxiensis]